MGLIIFLVNEFTQNINVIDFEKESKYVPEQCILKWHNRDKQSFIRDTSLRKRRKKRGKLD
jgi:hypothetical protein